MLDALHSISARPVGPVASTAAARSGSFAESGFPGLGDYGRAARGKPDAAPDSGAAIAKNGQLQAANGSRGGSSGASSEGSAAAGEGDALHLSPEAEAQLRELKQRDAEVRAHERAHMAAGGQYVTGGPSYEYQRGPDGRQYAIGGHVSIDASSIPEDPEAGAAKARQVRRAALAPGEPSAQDRAVAARAAAQEMRAARDEQAENGEDAPAAAGVAGAQASSPAENLSRLAPAESATDLDDAGRAESMGTRESGGSASRGGLAHALLRAAETYAAMAQRGVMPTALAPGGTGISLQI